MGQRVPQTRCDRARAEAEKFYRLSNDTLSDYENWIKQIGQQSGQSAAVDSWLSELHSDNNTVENANEVADHLDQILRATASAYDNGKRDIHKLEGKLTEWIRAYTYSLNAAKTIKKECDDPSDYNYLAPTENWNNAFYDESSKITEDILKDWTPPH